MKAPKTRYIPAGSTPITMPGVDAVVYLQGEDCAMGYIGKSSKRAFYLRFAPASKRAGYIARWFDDLLQTTQEKATRKQARQEFVTSLKPGDILEYVWGYEQSNAEFYQVLAVKGPQTIVMQQVATKTAASSPLAMSGYAVPVPDVFMADSTPVTKHVKPDYMGRASVAMKYGRSALAWDGRPVYCSWYA